jgi:hypothetical protein
LPKFNEAQGAWEPEEHEIDRAAEQASLLRAFSKAPAHPAPQPNPILFHPDLVDREFGSHLIAVPKLTEWAANQGLEVVTQPPIGGFQFVQVEAFLCAIESAARENTPEPMAAAIVQATPHLASSRAAEVAPRWLVGADAHLQWRRLLEKAVEAGELALLHFGSKLPIQASTEPQAAPVATESASNFPGTGKVWTTEKLAEVKAYRQKHGTKKTAAHYQVTEQRIRQLLPGEKPKAKGYSAFTHHMK